MKPAAVLLLLLSGACCCYAQPTVTILPASAPNAAWYLACAQSAVAQVALQVALPAQFVWSIELKPASSFADPGILGSTEISVQQPGQPYEAYTAVNVDHAYHYGPAYGDCPSDEYDLQTALEHELVHALGVNGNMDGQGAMTVGRHPTAFDQLVTDSLCQPVGTVPSPNTPYYFDCKYRLQEFGYHYPGDPLMSPVLDPGYVCRCLSDAVLDTLSSLGWQLMPNATTVCSSALARATPVVFATMAAALLLSVLR